MACRMTDDGWRYLGNQIARDNWYGVRCASDRAFQSPIAVDLVKVVFVKSFVIRGMLSVLVGVQAKLIVRAYFILRIVVGGVIFS